MCLSLTTLPNKLLPEHHWQKVPCGKCPECLSLRAVHWATRVEHELTLSDNSSFITLTYDDSKSSDFDYHYTDFQRFLKKLRERYKHQKLKHFTSIEYGGQNGRLHFHSILFNYYPTTRNHTLKELKTTSSGFKIYRSSELESLWNFGYSSVAPASASTAFYIASYALSNNSYECPISGEIKSDCLRNSRGIGLDYFIKHRKQIIASAFFNGHSIPRYYKKKLEELFPVEYINFTKKLTELKDTIIETNDAYPRLKEFLGKSSIMDTEFRKTKSFEILEAQLNDFAYDKIISRKYDYKGV